MTYEYGSKPQEHLEEVPLTSVPKPTLGLSMSLSMCLE